MITPGQTGVFLYGINLMPFTLDNVVPWGRSYDEYVEMFALDKTDLDKRILGCGDGPSSFNAALTRHGGRIVSVDPLYAFSREDIELRIDETFQDVMEQTRANMDEFVWDRITSPDELGRIRMSAMEEFLADYPGGRETGRYVAGELPALPFPVGSFELSLCSHLLFLYSEQLSIKFHIDSLTELLRVSPEVRVFPLLELGGRRSRHLDPVMEHLVRKGVPARIETVPYEFQKGGNEMLVIEHHN